MATTYNAKDPPLVVWKDWGWCGKCGKHELCAWADGTWSVHLRFPSHVGGYPSRQIQDYRGKAPEDGIDAAKHAAVEKLKALLARAEIKRTPSNKVCGDCQHLDIYAYENRGVCTCAASSFDKTDRACSYFELVRQP